MGIFGRSAADQQLIDRLEQENKDLRAAVSVAYFRDSVTGRMLPQGVVPPVTSVPLQVG